MGARFDELIVLKLNEIGDLAAGVFGPVAFLWLILGYLQQGRELRLSSEALQLQAKELRLSVDQQREMVGIAGRQLEVELDKVLFEREQRNIALLPNFKLQAVVPSASENLNVSMNIRNLGGLAEDLEILLVNRVIHRFLALENSGSIDFKFGLPREDGSYDFSLRYKYGEGVVRADRYRMRVDVTSAIKRIAQISFIQVKEE
ncbi:hypothetical protein N8H74_26380 [Pseudomonas sp. B2M1-30]|uniref:hypothetical protein n=1 Tax=Pseudomonas TaxID=286 RepID=UPI0021C6EE3D|nr:MULTISPECIES: hypothetical protein [Pseudomonas]MCU0121803.1 hypothetical protein [Pseudomonas sp. B2M1-30]MCU7264505.1 hypothetical protein [Pseudomonas koreensis]